MLPTPDTSHVSFSTIYEPAEDSYLLLDTFSSITETTWLHTRFKSSTPMVLEVGAGSGVVIAFLSANAEFIFNQPILSIGIDVNANACSAAQKTVAKALKDPPQSQSQSLPPSTVYLGSIQGDLCSTLRLRSIDVLVFNPPYVPSEELPLLPNVEREYRDKFERDSHLLSLSYDGGRDGMETTDRLLAQIPLVLSANGVAYVLLCAQNKPAIVKEAIAKLPNGPWLVETVGSSGKKAGWEKLQIVRIWREK